jgi:transposase
LVFLDESGANTQMQRLYGRAPRGQRAYGVVPHGRHVAVTMVAAIRRDGPVAPRSFVGAMNGERFRDWVSTALCPCLGEGDVVVMDNLPAHKDKKAVAWIEGAKARVLDLPPYSPDLNPDEKLWSKTKSILRRLAERSVAGLLSVIGRAVAQVTANDCAGFFTSCGYV